MNTWLHAACREGVAASCAGGIRWLERACEVQIRSYLSEAEAKQIGHVGYAVRYSMGHKGWGTRLMRFAVEELRRIQVSPMYIACHVDKAGSNRVSCKVSFQYVETRGKGSDAENVYMLK